MPFRSSPVQIWSSGQRDVKKSGYILRFIERHRLGFSAYGKTSVFCTKNGSYIPRQHFQGNHKNRPCRAACRFSYTFWAIHCQCNKGRGLCKGSVCFVLFCFGALPLHGMSPSARTGQPLQEPSEQVGSLLNSRFLPTMAADLTLNRKHSHLCTLSETREKRTMQKNKDFRCLGFVNIVRGGKRGWHWADM